MSAVCFVEGCGKPVRSKGLCNTHYVRQHTYGRLDKLPKKYGPVCTVEGCDRVHKSNGFCQKHYKMHQKYGRTERLVLGYKRAHPLYVMWSERKTAGALVPEWCDFWAFVEGVGERPSKNHILVRDKDAPWGPSNFRWYETLRRKKGETLKQFWARKWQSRRKNFPLYEADRNLRRKYGINYEQYKQMLHDQHGVCAICHKEEASPDGKTGGTKSLAVDHCHKTKKVRGLLCKRCNTFIGGIEESIDLLCSMVVYLDNHKSEGQQGIDPATLKNLILST